MPNFGWSYPPGVNSVPGDEDNYNCIVCGVAVPKNIPYCGPSCERADEENMADDNFWEWQEQVEKAEDFAKEHAYLTINSKSLEAWLEELEKNVNTLANAVDNLERDLDNTFATEQYVEEEIERLEDRISDLEDLED